MSRAGVIIRGVLGLAVIIGLLVVLNGWWTEYKSASEARRALETTSTVSSEASQAQAAQQAETEGVLILVDGLNFREQPDATGKSLRGLKKGERLVIVAKNGTWLQVRDASGAVGWVTYNPQYVRIEKL